MAMFPPGSADRKNLPIYSGVLNYFPDAIAYVAFVSKVGNDKHNPGQAMHWAREKSTDHYDCVARHLTEAGTYDADGLLNEGTMAWRALAALQLRLEELRSKGHDIWDLNGGKRYNPATFEQEYPGVTAEVTNADPARVGDAGGSPQGPVAQGQGTEGPVANGPSGQGRDGPQHADGASWHS